MYQVMIVDDEKMIVNSLALGFDWKSCGFEVVATCTSSHEALRMIEFIRPDIVFTDIRMPGITGLDLMRKIRQKLPQIQFVIISGYADFSYAQEALRFGALSYCLKPLEDEEIQSVLETAKKELDARHLVIQSAFEKLLRQSTRTNSRNFLHALMPDIASEGEFCVAVCAGNARPLLAGNVSFSYIEVSEQCGLYVISSNAEYLNTFAFRTALLNAATNGQIISFAFQNVSQPEAFFETELDNLFNAAYSFFMHPLQVVLGSVPNGFFKADNSFLEAFSAAANKNKFGEMMDLLSQLTEEEQQHMDAGVAVAIHNICTTAIARAEGNSSPVELQHSFELTEHYRSFDIMRNTLLQRLGSLNGSVNMDLIRNQTLRNVLEYLNRHFSQAISFQELCELHNINGSYLSQLFKKELGITFTAYLTQLRMNRAKELLKTTNLRISEISDALGYDYYFNFTKLFKKEVGMTPKEYRNTYSQ